MNQAKWALAAFICILAGVLSLGAYAQVSGVGSKKMPPTLKAGIVAITKDKEPVVDRLLKALGPAAIEQIRAGRTVELPGLGMFRVVRVAEHKDLVRGIPTNIPARNYIEFIPTADLERVANLPGAVPSRTVEGYEFRVLPPGVEPGMKTEGIKVPRTRPGGR